MERTLGLNSQLRDESRSTIWPLAALAFLSCAGCAPEPLVDEFTESEISAERWQLDMDDGCRFGIVDKGRNDDSSLRISAPADARCEITPKLFPDWQRKFLREPFGEERHYRFSVLVEDLSGAVPSDDITDNTIVAQWHSSPDFLPSKEEGRGPPLALRIHNGRWGLTYGWDADFKSRPGYIARQWHWVGPVETGRWVDWSFRAIWDHTDDGILEVRRDGRIVMQRSGPNAYNDLRGVYLKLGLYHPTIEKTILLDRVSITGGSDAQPESRHTASAGAPERR